MTSRILGIYHRRTLPWTQRQEKKCPTLGDTGLWLVDFRSLNPFPHFWEKGHCLSRTLQPLGWGPWGHPTVREVFSSFREHPPPNRRQCPCGPAARPWGRGLKFGLPPKLALRGGFGSSSLSGGWSREVCEGSGTEMKKKESRGKGALVGKWVTALGTWGSSPGGQE